MTTNPYLTPEDEGYTPPQAARFSGRLLFWLGAVVVIGLLVALLLPTRRTGSREAARRMQCSNHLKQIGLALQNYHDEFGCLPPAYVADSAGKPMHSWRVLILPYLGQKPLYDKYRFDEPWDGPNNSQLHGELVPVYRCASRPTRQRGTDTSYVVVVDAKTAWPGAKAASYQDITDGTSNTILVTEMDNSGIHWLEPRDLELAKIALAVNPKNGSGISSPHPNVVLAVFADGHTAAITNNTPAQIIQRLLTIADGQEIGDY